MLLGRENVHLHRTWYHCNLGWVGKYLVVCDQHLFSFPFEETVPLTPLKRDVNVGLKAKNLITLSSRFKGGMGVVSDCKRIPDLST